MIPLIPLAASLWSQWKSVIFLGLLAVSFGAGWEMKSRSIVKQFAKEESKAVVQAQKEGKAAVVRAAEDVAKIKELEKENDELLKQLDEIPSRATCKPSADELRILRELAESTK